MADYSIVLPQASLKKMVMYPKQTEKATRMAVTQIATDIMTLAVQLSPYLTGTLRRSLVYNPGKIIGDNVIQLSEGQSNAVVGSRLPYARIQDLGSGTGKGIKGNRYMSNAYAAIRRNVNDIYANWFERCFK